MQRQRCTCGAFQQSDTIEAPLKFRASGVTIPIGLGMGRIVFPLNRLRELTQTESGALVDGAGLPHGS
jgi:hypothetical protein